MSLKRILCLVVTSPIWVLWGALIASVYVVSFPIHVVFWTIACIEYGFTGIWHDIWHDSWAGE